MPPLTMSLSWITPSTLRALGDDQRRAALAGDRLDALRAPRPGTAPPCSLHAAPRWRRRRPCGSARPSRSTPLMRVCAVNGHEVRAELVHVALAQAVLLLGEHDDAAAFGRLVGERGELRRVGERARRRRRRPGRNAVAWRLPSVIVPVLSSSSTSTSPAASTARPDMAITLRLDHAVHAGDADRREQAADRGRDQADQQRHEHGDGDRRALAGLVHAVDRERQQRDGGEQEDDRERRPAGC